MSELDDKNRDYVPTPDEMRALAALGDLAQPTADPSARARTRAAFLAAAPPVARPRRPWRVWVPMAAAAVLVLAAIAAWQWSSQPRYMWWVMDVAEPGGIAMIGGPPETGAMLNEGPIRTAEGSEVEVQLGQELRFRLLGDGAIDLPAAPRRWPRREVVVTVRDGEIFGTTAGEGMDVAFRVVTPQVEAQVIGTTFAVFQTAEGTCVCLLKGTVRVKPHNEATVYDLPPERKFYVYADGTQSEFLELDPMELMKLQMMADSGVLPVVGKD